MLGRVGYTGHSGKGQLPSVLPWDGSTLQQRKFKLDINNNKKIW